MKKILIYGAYGYTGKLIVQEALDKGLKPVLAGRNEGKLKNLAEKHELSFLAFDLAHTEKLESILKDTFLVIHCAGPFSKTAMPMVTACIKTKTHYLDITGEYNVFQQIHSKDSEARHAGIMLLPGAGFDVVPSDCLAQRLYQQLPEATHLLLAFQGGGGLSRGTAKTMVEGSAEGQAYRQNDLIKYEVLGKNTTEVDFGDHKQLCVAISWGDIVTAYYSTGIPNIEVYTASSPKQISQLRWMHRLRGLMKLSYVKNFLKKLVEQRIDGPSEEKRAKSSSYLYGNISNGREEIEGRLITPNGYTLTAKASVLIALKIMNGDFKAGYQTPAMAYGEGLITEVEGCEYF